MAIDLTTERALSLAEAARLIPSGRAGRHTHISRLVRWITHGTRTGSNNIVRLEALRLGGRWVTTAEAIQRYAEQLTPTQPPPVSGRTPTVRSKSAASADRELTRLGI